MFKKSVNASSECVTPSVRDMWRYKTESDPIAKYFWFNVASDLMGLLIKKIDKSKYERQKKDRFIDFVRLKLVYPILYIDYDEEEPIKFEERESDHVQSIFTKLSSRFNKRELNEGLKFLSPLRMYIFHVLLTEQRVFTSDIAKRLHPLVTKSQVSEELTKLVDSGYLKQVGMGHYRLADVYPIDFLDEITELFDEYVRAFNQDKTENVISLIIHEIEPKYVPRFALLLYLESKRKRIKDLIESVPIVFNGKFVTVKTVLEFYPHLDLEKISLNIQMTKTKGNKIEDTLKKLVDNKLTMLFDRVGGNGYRFASIEMLKIMPSMVSLNILRNYL